MCVSYEIMDRVSIRFTLAISIVDVLQALIFLFLIKYKEDGAICSGIGFSSFYLTLTYLFLNAAVALNLQLVFVHGIVFDKEWLMWTVSLGFPLLLLAPPLFAGRFGLTYEGGVCDIRDPKSYETYAYLFSCFTVWGFLAIIYCTIAVVMVNMQLYKKKTVIDSIIQTKRCASADILCDNLVLKKKILKLINRVSMYCIIPIITQLWFLIVCLMLYHEEIPVTLRLFSIVGTDIPGILNLVVLLLDPAFAAAFEAILRNRNIKVPRFLDSRLPTEKLPPPPCLLPDPVLPGNIEEVGYFVPLPRISPAVHSITPEPSTRCFPANFLSCFRPHATEEDSRLQTENPLMALLSPFATPSDYQCTREATSFIKRI
ncbi:hypothetical protein DSO57_1005008 [Entomophthora muscae]|uniref:Uncharacterized protein n=1 Tax=Entomophthora muscae TaxID=34485 RepID=A0ACC2SXV2_9FUNG|nr:hypothetical protein DSO57_1005008 [Entomophthora muscae]